MKVERITPIEPIQPTHNERRPRVPDTEDGGRKKKKKEEPTFPIAEDTVTLSGQHQSEDEEREADGET